MRLSSFSLRTTVAAACVVVLALAGCDAADDGSEDPGPDPEGAWSALGQGTNGPVHAIAVDNDGNVYAGGAFTQAGGATVNHIAKWDGESWHPLGTGIPGVAGATSVDALAIDHHGNLYAGGRFFNAGGVEARGVAMWDGSSWSSLAETPSWEISEDGIFALAVDSEGNLYVGGNWSAWGVVTIEGVRIHQIAKWDGSTWSGLGPVWIEGTPPIHTYHQGIAENVRTIAIDESDNVYLGGDLSWAGGETTSSGIVKWDGENWIPLGAGAMGGIWSLAFDGAGNLYAGGHFTVAGDMIADNVAVWNGTAWSALGGGIPSSSPIPVRALEMDAVGRLYAGGTFTQSTGAPVNYLATWDGSEWAPVGAGPGGRVHALAADGAGNLYVGGSLMAAYNNIAKWSN